MQRYEYKTVPAPQKGTKAKGVKQPEERFALAIEEVLNRMGAEGWEYLRAELLPSEERSGFTGSTVNWRNLLVFRRQLGDDDASQKVAEPATRPVPEPEIPTDARQVFRQRKDPPLTLKPEQQTRSEDSSD